MLIYILLFILGLVLLIKGGDWFVDGAVGIAHKFNMPEILIGATVVSIGTTLPEVMVSAGGALQGIGAMAYGNALGSIICNTALIAAITVAIKPSDVDKKSLRTPVLFFFLAAAVYLVSAYVFGTFNRITGIVLLVIFVTYMTLAIKQAFRDKQTVSDTDENKESSDSDNKNSIIKFVVLLVIGAALIAFGADLLVDNGTNIAKALGIPATVIALTVVALGTSLPELVTAITALAKGSGALSLGNVIGANMFNLVLVSGLSITLAPFDVPCDKVLPGTSLNSSLVVDIPVMMFVMILLTIPALIRGKLSRIQGIILLLTYFAFCTFQFVM